MKRILVAAVSLAAAGCGGSASEAVYEGARAITAMLARTERVSREHPAPPPETAWIARRLEPETRDDLDWITAREAELDLDQLEWLVRGKAPQLRLEQALDAVRAGLGEGISRREFARQIVRALASAEVRGVAVLAIGWPGVGFKVQDLERRKGESNEERSRRVRESMAASVQRSARAATPVLIDAPGTTPFEIRALPLGFAAVDPATGRALDAEHPYIDAYDGRPLDEWLEAARHFTSQRHRLATMLEQVALLRLESGAPASPELRVSLRNADGSGRAERVVRLLEAPRATDRDLQVELRENDIGVLTLPRLLDAGREAVRDAFDDVEDARALVVDLRGNDCGEPRAADLLAAFLGCEAHRDVEAFEGRIVLLVDGGTSGEAERLVDRMRDAVTVVGTTTGGAAGRLERCTLENSGLGIRFGEGDAGEATNPDVVVTPCELDVREGRDVMLESAVEALGD